MSYMDQVLCEVLRFHTLAGLHQRIAAEDYKLQGDQEIDVPKGTMVFINVGALHFNPKHYANPNSFDPEHFSKEAKAQRHPYAYQPFGQGPHNCIGMRFALLEAKLAMTRILKRYTILPSEKTKEPVRIDPVSAISYAKDGLYL